MSGSVPERQLIQNIPVNLESDKHLFTSPLDVNNTSIRNLLYLVNNKHFTPSVELNPIQKGTVCAVLAKKELFEYDPSVEFEMFFRKQKDPIRYKVYVGTEANICAEQPENIYDQKTIASLPDYRLIDENIKGVVEGDIVEVDIFRKVIVKVEKNQDSNTGNGSALTDSNKAPSPSQAFKGKGPVPQRQIPADLSNVADQKWTPPVEGTFRITSLSGIRIDPINRNNGIQKHGAIDIAAPTGTPLYAVADGVIIDTDERSKNTGFGNFACLVVKIEDKLYMLTYGHMSERSVIMNQKVNKGDIIGYVGSTGKSSGPHLHFQLNEGTNWQGEKINPFEFTKLAEILPEEKKGSAVFIKT